MPEGPEVRKYADALQAALAGKRIAMLTARTRAARAYLEERGTDLVGRQVERVYSHGKNLIGEIEGGFWFYSHLMMWGRWQVTPDSAGVPPDRRERARIVAEDGTAAILYSAPVFEVGMGDPGEANPYLRTLGPDALPYPKTGPFAAACFQERLTRPENWERAVGAVLLDQTVVAGLGNYLRCDILWLCRLSPFRPVASLTGEDLALLYRTIPETAARTYQTGATAPEEERERMRQEPALRYPKTGIAWATRHLVFRRTNLPCLRCGSPIRQRRQVTRDTDEGQMERITYFCPCCQLPPTEPEAWC